MPSTHHTSAETPPQTDDQIIAKHDRSVRRRARTEIAIVHRVIKDLKKAGYILRVDQEGEIIGGSEQRLVSAIFELDEADLLVKVPGEKDYKTFVKFVMGNDGHDVISDYGISLAPIMEIIGDWIDSQMDAGQF